MEINKNIPVPLYYQLKELLQNDIAKGKYEPGDLIPTEVKLMEKYDLSRTTVRQAINALVYEGYLDRKKGVGTTVLSRDDSNDQGNLPNQIKLNGYAVSTKLQGLESIRADSSIADKLDININDKVYVMERVRYGDDIPLVYSRTFIAEKTAPKLRDNIDTAYTGFHNYLFSVGRAVKQISRTSEGGITDDKTAELLGLKPNVPIIIMTDQCFSSSGKIIEYTVSIVNTNVLKLNETINL